MSSSQPQQYENKTVNNQLHSFIVLKSCVSHSLKLTVGLNMAMAGGCTKWLRHLLTKLFHFQSERDLNGAIAAASNVL